MLCHKFIILIAFTSFLYTLGWTQDSIPLDQRKMANIIDTCISAFKMHYVYPEKMSQVEKYIKNNIERGKYDEISSLYTLTQQIKNDFRHITNDRHIWIDIIENLPIKNSDASDQDKINELKKNNFGFVKFEILAENIAYLRLDGFKNLDYSRETATAVMHMLANNDAIVLDLRYNHGGNSNMVHFISSYFFKQKTQLNSLYFREDDSLATAWTNPNVPGKKLLHQNLFILTSKNTASAAESFTYTMKTYQRATVIGETTSGTGHWVESYQYPEMGIFLEIPVARPINPISNKGWEGEGVKPDVKISADKSLELAYELAAKKNKEHEAAAKKAR